MLEVAEGRSLDAALKHNAPTFSSPGFDQTIAHPQKINSLQSFNCIAEEAMSAKLNKQNFGALGGRVVRILQYLGEFELLLNQSTTYTQNTRSMSMRDLLFKGRNSETSRILITF